MLPLLSYIIQRPIIVGGVILSSGEIVTELDMWYFKDEDIRFWGSSGILIPSNNTLSWLTDLSSVRM